MEENASTETDPLFDLESGWSTSKDDLNNDTAVGSGHAMKLLSGVVSGVLGFDGSDKDECSVSLEKFSEVQHVNIELLVDKISRGQSGEHAPLLGKNHVNDKRKVVNSIKAAKPPRPPKGPSLDAADLQLVKEISDLTMKKRARNERMKALKKMKAAKPQSSFNSTLIALIITLLFCFVIIFQGILSQNRPTLSFHGSPEPAAAASGLISVQLYDNHLASDSGGPSSESTNSQDLFLLQNSVLQDE